MKNPIKKAFTLIELIIVIAIVAILAAAIFVAVDPARRLHEARNAVRSSDTATILEAVKKYQVDNGGTHVTAIATGITAGEYHVIGTAGSGCNSTCTAQTTQADCVDISGMGNTYLAAVPMDPSTGTAANTDYYLVKGSTNEITVGACDAEGEGAGGAGSAPAIEVTR